MIWGSLLHLSFNMWEEAGAPIKGSRAQKKSLLRRCQQPVLRFDDGLWNELLERMRRAGMNMVVIDLGDGVRYDSHPEIAVRHAWSPARLRKELARMRSLGLEPIPKLNFSTTHDAWLGPYARCVSTPAYYAVCRDLIAEVCALFGRPRFFHLGMDEETANHQRFALYAVMRQHDLWWHDLYFLAGEVEKASVRPWIWSDYVWHHPDEFFRKMPKSILQSNWYYGLEFNRRVGYAKAYLDLEAHGYDQIPTACGGYYKGYDKNLSNTVDYCRKMIAPQRLLGFLQTSWQPTVGKYRSNILKSIGLVAAEVRKA